MCTSYVIRINETCYKWQHICVTHRKTLQHSATHYNALQHTATTDGNIFAAMVQAHRRKSSIDAHSSEEESDEALRYQVKLNEQMNARRRVQVLSDGKKKFSKNQQDCVC